MFKLNKLTDDIRGSNSGMMRYRYAQLTQSRTTAGDEFTKGNIDFKFNNNGNTWALPSKMHIEAWVTVSKGDNNDLDTNHQVALAYNAAAGLFQNIEFMSANSVVCDMSNGYVPQIDTLKKRMSGAKDHNDSVQASSSILVPSFDTRYKLTQPTMGKHSGEYGGDPLEIIPSIVANYAVTEDGDLTSTGGLENARVGDTLEFRLNGDVNFRTVLTTKDDDDNGTVRPLPAAAIGAQGGVTIIRKPYELLTNVKPSNGLIKLEYKPALPICDINHALPPGGEWKLRLQPNQNYQQAVVESLFRGVGGDAENYKVRVDRLYVYVAMVEGDRYDNDTFRLDLNTEISCQSRKYLDNQETFTVPSSTHMITVASQHISSGTAPRYSPQLFKSRQDHEKNITKVLVQYANQTQPEQLYQLTADGWENDELKPLYYQNLLNMSSVSDMRVGRETYVDWLALGPYFNFVFKKDGMDRSQTARVDFLYNIVGADKQLNLLVFSHYRSLVDITISGGRVVSVIKTIG